MGSATKQAQEAVPLQQCASFAAMTPKLRRACVISLITNLAPSWLLHAYAFPCFNMYRTVLLVQTTRTGPKAH